MPTRLRNLAVALAASVLALPAAAQVQGSLLKFDAARGTFVKFTEDMYLLILDRDGHARTVSVKAGTGAFTVPGLRLGAIRSVGLSTSKDGQPFATVEPIWPPGTRDTWPLLVTFRPAQGTGSARTPSSLKVTAVLPS